jgi:hypothetical protein
MTITGGEIARSPKGQGNPWPLRPIATELAF